MFPQLYTATSGLVAGERALELVANNLANARTPGFRPDRPIFSSYLEAIAQPNPQADPEAPSGSLLRPLQAYGVTLSGTWQPDVAGPIRETGSPLDLAIQGRGWFRIGTARGERLTRAGSFTRAADGRIVTPAGDELLDAQGSAIVIPEGRLDVAADGTMTVDGAQVAQLGLAEATGRTLIREGDTLWKPSGPLELLEDGASRVLQGHIEESGVSATRELVTLVAAQRLFEMQQRIVHMTANVLAPKALDLANAR
ncbi:MAG: flagellar hook basal-body protein [Acidobacteriota bacterium]|nr:MAG: flagellar hook basal-body protein [Acidobacteriota bacterium]